MAAIKIKLRNPRLEPEYDVVCVANRGLKLEKSFWATGTYVIRRKLFKL